MPRPTASQRRDKSASVGTGKAKIQFVISCCGEKNKISVFEKKIITFAQKAKKGCTPLEVAVNRYDVVTYPVQRVLIENKANMNFYVKKYFLNEPLLFCYIHWRQFELAELAIENGADVNMKTKDYGDSILKFAERRGTPAIVSKLKAKGAKYD